MKLLRIIAAVAAIVMAIPAMQAQTAAEVAESQARMLSAKTPCNQGPEAFKTFIEKFNTDSTFMASRIALDDVQRAKYAALLVPGNFCSKAPYAKDGEELCQMWGELQYNKAYLDCLIVDSYATHTFAFYRNKEGLWTLGRVVEEE